jgi:hypothetical protein
MLLRIWGRMPGLNIMPYISLYRMWHHFLQTTMPIAIRRRLERGTWPKKRIRKARPRAECATAGKHKQGMVPPGALDASTNRGQQASIQLKTVAKTVAKTVVEHIMCKTVLKAGTWAGAPVPGVSERMPFSSMGAAGGAWRGVGHGCRRRGVHALAGIALPKIDQRCIFSNAKT